MLPAHPRPPSQWAAGSDRPSLAPQLGRRIAPPFALVPTFGPVLVVLACACALWAVSGVSLRDIVLFVGYEAVFVLGPGWVVYGILRPRAGRLERLAFGWGLGYVLEVGVFAVTAALGARGLLIGYPLLPGVLALWQRIRAPRRTVPLRLDDAR